MYNGPIAFTSGLQIFYSMNKHTLSHSFVHILQLVVAVFMITSCKTPTNVVYLQDIQPNISMALQEERAIRLQPGDRLSVIIPYAGQIGLNGCCSIVFFQMLGVGSEMSFFHILELLQTIIVSQEPAESFGGFVVPIP